MKNSQLYRNLIAVLALVIVSGSVIAYADFVRTGAITSHRFDYGYGYGYAEGYGYGYGYHTDLAFVPDKEQYGFLGTGEATSVSATAAQTSITVTFSTSYLSMSRIIYGLGSGPSELINVSDREASYTSGSRSITISNLSCETLYYYEVDTLDAGSNNWFSDIHSISTTSCNSSGGLSGVILRYYNNGLIPEINSDGSRGGANPHKPAPFLHNIVKQGAIDGDILRLQKLLNSTFGFVIASSGPGSPGNETNVLGVKTRNAIRRFQQAHHITPRTGLLGPKTRAAINALIQ